MGHLELPPLTQTWSVGSVPGPLLCGSVLVTPFSFLPQPLQNATKYGNMTQDHVMHVLLVSAWPWPCLPTQVPLTLRSRACTILDSLD